MTAKVTGSKASASANLEGATDLFHECLTSQSTLLILNTENFLPGLGAVFHVPGPELTVFGIIPQQIQLTRLLLLLTLDTGELLHGLPPLGFALTEITIRPPDRHQKSKRAHEQEQTKRQTHTCVHALSAGHDLVVSVVPGSSRPTLSLFLQCKRRVIAERGGSGEYYLFC